MKRVKNKRNHLEKCEASTTRNLYCIHKLRSLHYEIKKIKKGVFHKLEKFQSLLLFECF